MKALKKIKGIRSLFLLLAGSGASAIFPPFIDAFWGYVFLILFLGYLFTSENRKMFYNAFVFGFGYYAAGFSWINNALLIDGDQFINYVPLVFMTIGIFFALFWAIPAWLASRVYNQKAQVIFFIVLFVLFEWIRSFIFTGFPWNLLGTALSFSPALIRGAAYFGTYGLSLFMMCVLCGAALILFVKNMRFFGGCLMLLGGIVIGGFALTYHDDTEDGVLTVRLVQPSIPQTLKWDNEVLAHNFREYIDLSVKAKNDNVKLVVWGETATPYYLDRDLWKLREITEAIPENGFLITGLLRAGMESGRFVPYNSMFVINKDGVIKDYYDKAHLVPFGEFLPFRKYLPEFMTPIANTVGELGRGEKYKNINVEGLPLLGAAICYESIFPHEVVNPINKPEVLVVLANDGWYGVSFGPAQHLAAAQLRAVEEGITVIRSANTGISAVIDYNGKIKATLGLNEKGYLDVVLPKNLAKNTIYGRFGNIIPLVLIVLMMLCGFYLNSPRGCKK